MQTETLPDAPTLPGLTLIEGIDMDAEVQCGHPSHSRWAPTNPLPKYVVRYVHRPCGRDVTSPICLQCWDRVHPFARCRGCSQRVPSDVTFTIIEHLR